VHWPFRLGGEARRWRQRFDVQTVSAHSGRELRAAATLPVAAVLVSAVFASNSPSAGPPIGAFCLRQWARLARTPVYALGGVTADTAGPVTTFGGFAAVSGMAPFAKPRT
jgi:thiamine-phosphate pyrophosphorylase